jgi:hypothetical protein
VHGHKKPIFLVKKELIFKIHLVFWVLNIIFVYHFNYLKNLNMTLKQYIEGLQKFVEENPDALKLKVITSKDDEGNGFSPVLFGPSKGFYSEAMDNYIPECDFEEIKKIAEDPSTIIDSFELNSVCVN